MKKIGLLIFVLVMNIFFSKMTIASDALSFSGDVSGVSSYIWRGMKQFDGTALQGTATASYKFVSFGVWYSNYIGEYSMETDPFIEFSLPISKAFKATIGAALYTYDFKEYAPDIPGEYEIYAKGEYKYLALSAYVAPKQKSTEREKNENLYWLEGAITIPFVSADWTGLFGIGSYPARSEDDPAQLFGITISKGLTDNLSINYNASHLSMDDYEKTNIWVGVEYSF